MKRAFLPLILTLFSLFSPASVFADETPAPPAPVEQPAATPAPKPDPTPAPPTTPAPTVTPVATPPPATPAPTAKPKSSEPTFDIDDIIESADEAIKDKPSQKPGKPGKPKTPGTTPAQPKKPSEKPAPKFDLKSLKIDPAAMERAKNESAVKLVNGYAEKANKLISLSMGLLKSKNLNALSPKECDTLADINRIAGDFQRDQYVIQSAAKIFEKKDDLEKFSDQQRKSIEVLKNVLLVETVRTSRIIVAALASSSFACSSDAEAKSRMPSAMLTQVLATAVYYAQKSAGLYSTLAQATTLSIAMDYAKN